MMKESAKIVGGLIAGLAVFSLFLALWLPIQDAFRAVFGGFYVLIVPGLVMTYALFQKKELNFLERIPLGFGLSLGTLPFLIFGLSRLGMAINTWTILGVVTALAFVAALLALIPSKQRAP